VKVDTKGETVGLLDGVSDETKALAEAAQSIIERPQGIEKRRFVGDLLVRGYSPTAISMKYYDAYGKQLDRFWINKIHRKVHYSGKLKKISERQEERVLMQGLALKAERVQRLGEYVEALEPKAMLLPSKDGQEYRRGIQQIKEEVEGLGLDITFHPADAWARLLMDIKRHAEAAGGTTSLDRSGTGSGVHGPEPSRDST